MTSRGNQHCANCIGTLSFPVLKPRSVIRLQFDKRFRAKVSIRNTSFQRGMSDQNVHGPVQYAADDAHRPPLHGFAAAARAALSQAGGRMYGRTDGHGTVLKRLPHTCLHNRLTLSAVMPPAYMSVVCLCICPLAV